MKKIRKSKWKYVAALLVAVVLLGACIAVAMTATLTDLGLQSNQAGSTTAQNGEGEELSGTSYTVELQQTSNWALTNSTASTGPITLSYKVESATAAVSPSGSNVATGVLAASDLTEQIPWNSGGTIRYDADLYKLMKTGCTYTITIEVDSDNKVTCSGSYAEADGTLTEFDANGDFLTAAGTGAADCQYLGLYVALIGQAKLTNVTCVDAEGNDLGLQSNQSSCVITEIVEEPELSIGDANGDGVCDVADLVRYKRVIANEEGITFAAGYDADLNDDDTVDDDDATWLREYLVSQQ